MTFESFTSLSALAASTPRVRLGHIVICTAFRNPALTAKMISTMDVISGGRMELGIGAGWKRDEWLAYGYGFPETRERLAALADHLEVITRMLEPGKRPRDVRGHVRARRATRSTCPSRSSSRACRSWSAATGQNVTWRLAAKHADELNVDGMSPDERRRGAADHPVALRGDRPRPGDAAGVGPLWWRTPGVRDAGAAAGRPARAIRGLGVSRVMGLMRDATQGDEAVEALRRRCPGRGGRDGGACRRLNRSPATDEGVEPGHDARQEE